jgi:hypothetical protein
MVVNNWTEGRAFPAEAAPEVEWECSAMTDKAAHLIPNPNQTSMSDVRDVPAAPGTSATESSTHTAPTHPLYPPQGPAPEGINPAIAQEMAQEAARQGDRAPGVVGEQVVWEARYSLKKFLGRLIVWTIMTVAWLGLLFGVWSKNEFHGAGAVTVDALGVAVALAWIFLLFRMFQARQSHFYRLTTRRLFLSSGLFHRRRDQMELIGIKDVFERQTLGERWLSVGTVVVVAPKAELPTFYLTGVNDPKRVMDLIWHYARVEREGKTVQVENL